MTTMKTFIQGNKAVAESAIKSGLDFLVGYPITPSSEITEQIAQKYPKHFFQTSSEIESGNMLYGVASTGSKVMTATSGCGLSLMREALSYMVAAHLPCVIVDVMRMGPGLGNITPGTQDISIVKGVGHGSSEIIGLTPTSVQEIYDFIPIAFDLAFKHRIPVIVMYDAILGQMWEGCEMHDFKMANQDISWSNERVCTTFGTTDEYQKEQVEIVTNTLNKIEYIPKLLKPEIKTIKDRPTLSAIGLTARSVKAAADRLNMGYYIPKIINPLFGDIPQDSTLITVEIGGEQLKQLLNADLSIVFSHEVPTVERICNYKLLEVWK